MDFENVFVLIVEDDRRLANLTAAYLTKQGFRTVIEENGNLAPARILSEQPALVILDIMLPGQDGLAVCRQVRDRYNGWILMLTARDDDMDQILGLEIGADDYLVKPVHPRLLLARIRNLLQRGKRVDGNPAPRDVWQLNFGLLRMDARSREVVLGDEEIVLSTNEFDLLWLLASNAGRILSRDDILRELRGIDYNGIDRSVDVGVSRLRKKLGDWEGQPRRLKSVRSKGYLFVPDSWDL